MALGSFALGGIVTAAILYVVAIRAMGDEIGNLTRYVMYDRNVGAAAMVQSGNGDGAWHPFTNATPAQRKQDEAKKRADQTYFNAISNGIISDADLAILGEKEPVIS